MEIKFTQGEWKIVTNKHIADNDDVFIESDEALNDDFVIAELHGCDKEANAKLIAASPDLLKALQKLMAACNGLMGECEATNLSEAAIKKAVE